MTSSERAASVGTLEPIRLSFEVACPVDRAFHLWTADIATWWPKDHSVTGDPDLTVVLEPRQGGRIFERLPDGTEHDWGGITTWEPPRRFAYTWHLNTDRSDATDVEIRFTPGDDGMTRVEIEHTGWERLGARGEAWQQRNHAGWSTLLPYYVAATRG
ncbi:MAG TPA: SRPBCC family protein [Candidatus Acidoferrum sp.]|nr:SRPBCC family protein [Candidatus Acidoferrum sp.]